MRSPKISKGARSAVEVCGAAWIDLLGYGTMLRAVAFDPTSEAAHIAVERLNRFQAHVASAATKFSVALVINDGAVLCRDLSPRTTTVTFDFIRRVQNLHRAINAEEHAKKMPGARCVLAAGFRIRRKNHHKQKLIDGYGSYLIERVNSGVISAAQAIKAAITVKPFMAAMPEAQANFAFTKAYLAEQGGSKAGFSGPRFFLDTAFLRRTSLPWISFESVINWNSHGMTASFGAVSKFDVRESGKRENQGCRDAYEVAEALSGTPEILARLRDLRMRGAAGYSDQVQRRAVDRGGMQGA